MSGFNQQCRSRWIPN